MRIDDLEDENMMLKTQLVSLAGDDEGADA